MGLVEKDRLKYGYSDWANSFERNMRSVRHDHVFKRDTLRHYLHHYADGVRNGIHDKDSARVGIQVILLIYQDIYGDDPKDTAKYMRRYAVKDRHGLWLEELCTFNPVDLYT